MTNLQSVKIWDMFHYSFISFLFKYSTNARESVKRKKMKKQPLENSSAVIHHRNEFYRDGFRKLLTTLIGVSFIAIGSVAANIIFMTKDPVIQNFAVSEEGRIIPLVPMSDPYLGQASILAFAQRAATEPWNMDYVKYVQQLAAVKPLFTNRGYQSFLDAMQKSGNIDSMKSGEMIFYATAAMPPIIVSEGIHEGHYIWKMEVPVKLTMEGRKGKKTVDLLIRMIVTRVPLIENPKGVAVDLYLSQEKTIRS